MITHAHLTKAISYTQYRDRIDNLLKENKTTGENHTKELIAYTRLNVHRMHRIEKQATLIPELDANLKQPMKKELWIIISEAWCGDAAQSVPALQRIAQASDDITLKILLRDENLDVMDKYLTNGSRSIPKLICLDAETLEEKWTWGPRPAEAQALMNTLKKNENLTKEDKAAKLHGWYAKNKTESLQNEIWNLLKDEIVFI
ncbi:MAG: thioredoxin family protein [Balneolales bacterium]